MKKIRAAVVGVGYLGRFHAEKFAQFPEADLVAVVDVDRPKGEGEMTTGIPNVRVEEKSFEQGDPLKEEIGAFLRAVATGTPPKVTGKDGRKALEIALMINKKL